MNTLKNKPRRRKEREGKRTELWKRQRILKKLQQSLLIRRYRIDTLVEDMVAIENKAVEQMLPLHEAQLLTYMRLRNLRLGFLLNWNVVLMKKGIKCMVNGL